MLCFDYVAAMDSGFTDARTTCLDAILLHIDLLETKRVGAFVRRHSLILAFIARELILGLAEFTFRLLSASRSKEKSNDNDGIQKSNPDKLVNSQLSYRLNIHSTKFA